MIGLTSTTVPSTFDIWRDRDQLRLRADRVDHRLRVQIAIGVHIDPFQHHALPFAQEMPGHDIGVMLRDAQDDLVARLHPRHGPAIGDQVDPLRRAGGEDDLVGIGHAKEARDGAAHRLVFLGREVRQVVQAAMDVGVFHRIGLRDGVDHHLRLLRRGAIVEIDQRLAVHLAREDREIGADFVDIVHRSSFPHTAGEVWHGRSAIKLRRGATPRPRIDRIRLKAKSSAKADRSVATNTMPQRREPVQHGDEIHQSQI
jgi:hypothetical protein